LLFADAERTFWLRTYRSVRLLLYGIIGNVKVLTIRRRTKFDVQLTYEDTGRPKNIRLKRISTGTDPFSVGRSHDLGPATTIY
jgi:hypothetical protein